jgi:enamine deaminase RidA (YjgF/YER057c/UK114 family)
MTRDIFQAEHVNPPELGKPSGFSHAVRVTGGTTVYLAGQTALDAEGAIVGASVVEQFEQALGNLLTALRAAGGAPEDLVSLTVYIVDLADYRAHAREIGPGVEAADWRLLPGDGRRRGGAALGCGGARRGSGSGLHRVRLSATTRPPAQATAPTAPSLQRRAPGRGRKSRSRFVQGVSP